MKAIIPITKKDLYKVIRNMDNIVNNLGVEKVVLIGNKEIKENWNFDDSTIFLDEDEVYDNLSYTSLENIICKRNTLARKRTGWYLQQFLKMAYSYITDDKEYLVWDSDTIPLKPLSFFDEEGRYLYSQKKELYEPYFQTIETIFPFKMKRNNMSYITEHMIINSEIMRKMIKEIEENNKLKGESFWEKIIFAIKEEYLPLSGFSEFETYGTYIYNFYNNIYAYRALNTMRHGMMYFGINITEKELKWVAESYDMISFEHFEKKWRWLHILAKITMKKNKMSLKELDQYTGKVINTYHTGRRLIKDILGR